MSCFRVKGCFLKQGNDWHSAPPSFSARNLLYAKSIGQENKIDRMWLTAALLDLDRRARHRAVRTEYAAIAWFWHDLRQVWMYDRLYLGSGAREARGVRLRWPAQS